MQGTNASRLGNTACSVAEMYLNLFPRDVPLLRVLSQSLITFRNGNTVVSLSFRRGGTDTSRNGGRFSGNALERPCELRLWPTGNVEVSGGCFRASNKVECFESGSPRGLLPL